MANLTDDRDRLYMIADVLQLDLQRQRQTDLVDAAGYRAIDFMGSTIEIPVKVVSSALLANESMVVARFCGNLAALVIATSIKGIGIEIDFHLLNMAKMESPNGWLEKHWPKNGKEAVHGLGPAIVGSFRFDKDKFVKV